MSQYILSLDQGTTSSRAILFDKKGEVIALAQKEFKQIFPQSGWVEHDALEIWSSQAGVAAEATAKAGVNGKSIAAIGITNQRETIIVWNKHTGKPVYNAIVWQDRRTSAYCDTLKEDGKEELIRQKTGLIIDAYFSATKIKWILDHIPNARSEAEAGDLICGTVDSWLIWNFTKGELHITDASNASRTLLYNIHTLSWDDELLELFTIPKSMLPQVKASSERYGETKSTLFAHPVPISGIAGDQQAALFGQMCSQAGMVKNTYGTGCFMLMNIGTQPKLSKNNLLTTIAWQINGKTEYALEGSIFIAGAVIQWLRDGLGIIRTAADVEALALKVEDTGGVYFVPAFAGLGAPYWDSNARGTIVGLSRGTTAAHIARAAIESIGYQTADVLKAMEADAGVKISELRVDGGATANATLMQFQAGLLGCKVIKPKITETTALGAAYLAGLACGYWKDIDEIQQLWQIDQSFDPSGDQSKVSLGLAEWKRAIHAAQSWSRD